MECTTPASGWEERDPSLPAAIVFTSGTTSRPKAVVHSLDTLRSGARNMADIVEMTDRDVAFLSTPLASITGLVQTHLTTERGAGLLLEDRFEAASSLARLRAEGATVLGGAPVIIEELFKQAQAEDLHDLPLRTMALGGAMIPREILELAVERYGIRPVRVYGSSEVPVSTGTLPTDEGEGRIADDGACARGTEVRILGDQPGELLLRGPMRMLGYLDEGDNAEAFTDGGWYRTGDLGRFEGGRLTVTGRLKEIVSRKGLKISLTRDRRRRAPAARRRGGRRLRRARRGDGGAARSRGACPRSRSDRLRRRSSAGCSTPAWRSGSCRSRSSSGSSRCPGPRAARCSAGCSPRTAPVAVPCSPPGCGRPRP